MKRKPKRQRTRAKNNPGEKRKLTGVSDILSELRKSTPLGKNLDQAEIWTRWPELVGPKLCAHCRPKNIKDQLLRVEADSAVWMHRISYLKWNLVRRINLMAGKELISDIFIVLIQDHENIDGQK